MPLFDLKCEACGEAVERLVRVASETFRALPGEVPPALVLAPCERCGGQMQHVWSLRRHGDDEAANHASVRFNFNWTA